MIIRIAEAKDIPQIVDLLVTVFPHHSRSSRHWDWSHSGDRGLAVVAEHEGRIVGHYSLGFQPFEWRGRFYAAGLGQQAAVHPEHRDLRTIVELIRYAEQSASTLCDFVFAFPNRNMAPVKERLLDWKRVLEFPMWTLPLEDFSRRVRRRAGRGDRHSIKRLTTFSGLNCPCWEAPGAETLAPVKSLDWFEWRYIMHPLNHYACLAAFADGRCDGVIVAKAHFDAEQRRGHVVELHSRDGLESKFRLLSAAADFFALAGVERIFVWGQDKPNRSLYEALGFEPYLSCGTSVTSTLYAKSITEASRDAINAEWSFDMGVSDVF